MKKKPIKPDCYTCIHRGTVPGDAHSCCNHPSLGSINEGEALCIAMLGLIKKTTGAIEVKGNRHGILNGWFMWPVNFDPVWLETCTGYTKKPS